MPLVRQVQTAPQLAFGSPPPPGPGRCCSCLHSYRTRQTQLHFGQKGLETNPKVYFGKELIIKVGRRLWDDKHLFLLSSSFWHGTCPGWKCFLGHNRKAHADGATEARGGRWMERGKQTPQEARECVSHLLRVAGPFL